jgi:hypothetical protein
VLPHRPTQYSNPLLPLNPPISTKLFYDPVLPTSLPSQLPNPTLLSLAQSGAETEGKDAVPRRHQATTRPLAGFPAWSVVTSEQGRTAAGLEVSVGCWCRKVCLTSLHPMGGCLCPLKSDDHRPATTRPSNIPRRR